MIIEIEDDVVVFKCIGRIVLYVLYEMFEVVELGMIMCEFDVLGECLFEQYGV